MFLRNFFEKLNDIYYLKQIDAFSLWLLKNSLEKERVFIDLPHQERFLKNNFSRSVEKNKKISFVFCKQRGLKESLEKNNLSFTNGWQNIFLSNEFEIWENKEKYQSDNLPVRFGLNESEKEEALNHSRDTLENFLKTGTYEKVLPKKISQRFFERANVDVALWVNGELRGSRIVENLPLHGAIKEATIRACRDDRFKPLSTEELKNTTIEIAVFSDLLIPLLIKERASNTVYTEKGYKMSISGKVGWFFPAVFNCVTFRGLNDFLLHLIEKKVGISKVFLSNATVEIFEVDNFIESTKKKPLSLKGPIVLSNVDTLEIIPRFYESVNKSADFICGIQENDGNIPPVINPLTGKMSQIDWVRLSLTAWSLALWGETTKNNFYKESAKKSFLYLRENLYNHPYIPAYSRCLSLIYYRRLAVVLNEHEEVKKSGEVIVGLISNLDYEPILYSQIAVHLIDVSSQDNDCLKKAEELARVVLEDYQKGIEENRPHLELARYPELIYLLHEIGTRTENKEFVDKSEEINNWLISKQLNDGSFPSTNSSTFSYVRGTGKILEVLCLSYARNGEAITRAVVWVMNMQYSEDNTYFIKNDIKKKITGGFRHDYLDQGVWIDATAHLLIAATRLKGLKIS